MHPLIVSNSISLAPQQYLLTMFELFCLTKGKSLVVKCKINFYTKILIRVLWIVGMEILVTSQFVNKKSFQFHEPFFKVWLHFLFLLKIHISFSIEISLSKKLWKFQNLIIGTLKLSFYLFSHSIEYSPKEMFLLLLFSAFTRQSTFMTIIIPSIVSATDIHVSPWINKKERIRSIYKYLFQPRYRFERK